MISFIEAILMLQKFCNCSNYFCICIITFVFLCLWWVVCHGHFYLEKTWKNKLKFNDLNIFAHLQCSSISCILFLWQATVAKNATSNYCVYESDIATGFGAGALLLLLASQLLIMVASRCLCCGRALSPGRSRACAIFLFITCWWVFFLWSG